VLDQPAGSAPATSRFGGARAV